MTSLPARGGWRLSGFSFTAETAGQGGIMARVTATTSAGAGRDMQLAGSEARLSERIRHGVQMMLREIESRWVHSRDGTPYRKSFGAARFVSVSASA